MFNRSSELDPELAQVLTRGTERFRGDGEGEVHVAAVFVVEFLSGAPSALPIFSFSPSGTKSSCTATPVVASSIFCRPDGNVHLDGLLDCPRHPFLGLGTGRRTRRTLPKNGSAAPCRQSRQGRTVISVGGRPPAS